MSKTFFDVGNGVFDIENGVFDIESMENDVQVFLFCLKFEVPQLCLDAACRFWSLRSILCYAIFFAF